MTSGGSGVTNGGAGLERRLGARRIGPLATISAVGLVLALVNSFSVLSESQGHAPPWAPFLWEFSSVAIMTAMAPLIGYAVGRWPLGRDHLGRSVGIHAVLALPFSIAHVLAVFAIRSAVYALAGLHYAFFDHGILARFVYEGRKDVVVYAAIAVIYALFQRARIAAGSDARIQVRDGAGVFFLRPTDIVWVAAAGNYVEIHTIGRTHLVRGSLAAWETRLAGRGFVRAHRARLVNTTRIAELRPTPSGDVVIAFEDGRSVQGSRRYRGGLAIAG